MIAEPINMLSWDRLRWSANLHSTSFVFHDSEMYFKNQGLSTFDETKKALGYPAQSRAYYQGTWQKLVRVGSSVSSSPEIEWLIMGTHLGISVPDELICMHGTQSLLRQAMRGSARIQRIPPCLHPIACFARPTDQELSPRVVFMGLRCYSEHRWLSSILTVGSRTPHPNPKP